jgi:CoA:oxalate CoA-transferase
MAPPLAGVRILDLTTIISGPYGTMILGDLGAEIIKVERPGTGDGARGTPSYMFEGEGAYFIAHNRNKKSIVINLDCIPGREIFYGLVQKSDVVVNNYRPGVPEKLQIDYDTLRKINPRIITCSITGYGETGPFKNRPAFDLIIQARGGIMSYTGELNGQPVRMGAPMGDMAGGMFAAHGILAALYQRSSTGQGQSIDISLLDCQISLLAYRGQYYLTGGEIAAPLGTGHTTVHPQRSFKTRTFDIVLDCNLQGLFNEMVTLMGHPEMASSPKFDTRQHRFENKDELYVILEKIFLTRTGEEWLELLEDTIPIGPINRVDAALNDPQVLYRNMVPEIDYGGGHKLKIIGNPVKMSALQPEVFTLAPHMGEHTDTLLAELLDYSPEKIEELKKQQVIQ